MTVETKNALTSFNSSSCPLTLRPLPRVKRAGSRMRGGNRDRCPIKKRKNLNFKIPNENLKLFSYRLEDEYTYCDFNWSEPYKASVCVVLQSEKLEMSPFEKESEQRPKIVTKIAMRMAVSRVSRITPTGGDERETKTIIAPSLHLPGPPREKLLRKLPVLPHETHRIPFGISRGKDFSIN
ncbi:unnamed protein product [Nesidiocoris tenuis]|uniref:Uncharacterized protein n=1 Tax=Nesidiocoris tenuis TaxID=355587 RepID=A0A6H5G8V2_9HEMI|nr:unnamed protein product [Nesidiocoris tenuis]